MLLLALIPSLSGLNAEEWKQSINNSFTPKRRQNGETGKSPKAEGSSPAQAQRAGMDPTSKKQSRRVKQAGAGSGRLQEGDYRITEHWNRRHKSKKTAEWSESKQQKWSRISNDAWLQVGRLVGEAQVIKVLMTTGVWVGEERLRTSGGQLEDGRSEFVSANHQWFSSCTFHVISY